MVLFNQVRHSVLLSLVKPADQRRQEHAKGERVEHGARVYTSDPISGPRSPSVRSSNETLRDPHRRDCEQGDAAALEILPALHLQSRACRTITYTVIFIVPPGHQEPLGPRAG